MKYIYTTIVFAFISTYCAFAQKQSYIELKTYTCSSPETRDALVAIFDKALIPALNRQGILRAGVYTTSAALNNDRKEYDTTLYTIIIHPNLESFADCENKLLADKKYLQEAKAIFSAPMKTPLYDGCHSTLLCTFKACPEVTRITKSPDRFMQLRIYNSYNIERNAKKISMFEDGGEVQLFRDAGMHPVFFGHALSGDKLPNLTYMLSFDSQESKAEAWNKFINSEGWKKLKAEPQYKNTANKITNIILKASKNSQL